MNSSNEKFTHERGMIMNIAVVYWSGTGNTEQMAQKVLEGAAAKGASASLFTSDEFTAEKAAGFDGFCLGCPSMGAEQLEDGSFDPMYQSIASELSGKPVALFGSYGWGDGEWMRTWAQDAKDKGARLVSEGLMCHETPDDEVLAQCVALGEAVATA
ncbi:Flavodoxin [Clostridiaceae bacterium JG1575]|nr:Flavodoxin [Clostridiaceae bacterium JG1575]